MTFATFHLLLKRQRFQLSSYCNLNIYFIYFNLNLNLGKLWYYSLPSPLTILCNLSFSILQENIRKPLVSDVSDVFRGYRNRPMVLKGLHNFKENFVLKA